MTMERYQLVQVKYFHFTFGVPLHQIVDSLDHLMAYAGINFGDVPFVISALYNQTKYMIIPKSIYVKNF